MRTGEWTCEIEARDRLTGHIADRDISCVDKGTDRQSEPCRLLAHRRRPRSAGSVYLKKPRQQAGGRGVALRVTRETLR
jgi:hypothetical protein